MLAEGLFRVLLVAIAGIVIKDVLLVGMILALFAALQLAQSSKPGSNWWIASVALLAPILLVRPTNFLMFLIAWALLSLMLFRSFRAYLISLTVAAVLLVSVVPATNFVNRSVLEARNAYAEKQLIIFDIAGMSAHTGKNLFASTPAWPVKDLPPPIPCYTPKRWNPYYFIGECRSYAIAFNAVSRRHGNLTGWWFGQVVRHPAAYLQHRLSYSHKLLRTEQHVIFPKAPYTDTLNSSLDPRYRTKTYNAEIRETGRIGGAGIGLWPNTLAEEPFAKLSAMLFSQKNAYILSFILCLTLMGWSIRKHFKGMEVDPMVPIAAATGIGNVGMLVFFGVASEGRYLLPTICCAAMALLTACRSLTQQTTASSVATKQVPSETERPSIGSTGGARTTPP